MIVRLIEVQHCRRALLITYAIALLVLTLAPMPDAGGLPTNFDKFIHVGMFGTLAVLVHWNLIPAIRPRRAATLAAITAILTAVLIEILQNPLPYRDGDLGDLGAGSVGGLLGAVAAVLTTERRNR